MKINYIHHKLVDTLTVKKIVTLHYFELGKGFRHRGEAHDFWEMVYCDKGNMVAITEGIPIEIHAGECLFHQPNEFHIHASGANGAPNIFGITFVCNDSGMDFFRNFKTTVPVKLRGLISDILEEAKATFLPHNDPDDNVLQMRVDAILGGEQMIRTYLEQFLILLMRSKNNQSDMQVFATRGSLENSIACHMQDLLIRSGYQDTMGIEQLSQMLGYSKTYLSRIFKATYHCTVSEYAAKIKIEEAKRLIREEQYNFTQIAEHLHFPNPYYFSRVFKRTTGMSPSEYRKSILRG